MYKKANRFMNSRIGIDLSMSSRKPLGPIKPSRQELLLCAGMKAPDEADFMNRIQSELNKLVAKGIKNPRLQAEKLNKVGVLTAIGYRWDAARVVTFYERQKTRRALLQQAASTIKRIQVVHQGSSAASAGDYCLGERVSDTVRAQLSLTKATA